MSVLVLRTPCEHGEIAKHPLWCSDLDEAHDHRQLVDGCPGGSEVVLDPATVLDIEDLTYQNRDEFGNLTGGFYYATVTVADVVQALQGGET